MARRPNFVIFLTDDQGYGDLHCMGAADLQTPNLDRLAADGVRFTDWYSNSPVCSPSRAALLTGRYPGNAGVRAILAGHRRATGLPPSVPTLAQALKKQGYRTGLVGKWHLGLAEGCRPHERGFDESFGFLAGCVDYYSHIYYWGPKDRLANPLHDLWENGREVWRNGEYLTDLLSGRAVDFVRRSATETPEQPFFLFVAFNAPHYPMHAPPKYLDRFPDLPPDRRIMAAMLAAVDDGVGAVLAELEKHGLADDTCVFFQSDNGPSRETRNWLDGTTDPYYGGMAGKLKGHKFSLFDGGIRVPGLLRWPARVSAGQVIAHPCAAMDIFPTFLSAAGADPSARELDGADLLPLLSAQTPLPPRDLFWEMDNQTAIRRGNWKLVLDGRLVETEGPVAPVFLSDLSRDRGERDNLAAARPDIAEELAAAARTWRAGIEARWQSEWLPQQQSRGTT